MQKSRWKLGLAAVLLAVIGSLQVQGGAIARWFYDEFGFGIPGTTIDELVAATDFDRDFGAFPEELTEHFDNRQSTGNSDDGIDNFGSITRGFIEAPMDGTYTIVVGSDDNSELYLNTSDDSTQIINFRDPNYLVGFETGWTNGNLFTAARFDERSSQVELKRGQKYYVELLHKEGGGGSFISVGWTRPDGVSEIIPGYALAPLGSIADPFTPATSLELLAPQNVDVVEKVRGVFSVTAYGPQPMSFQWKKNGQDIDGATLAWYAVESPTLADNGDSYTVTVTDGSGRSQTSSAATLNVTPDSVAPEVTELRVSNLDPNVLTVSFSEPVTKASAESTSNYRLNNGATVQSATLSEDGLSVRLQASGIEDSQSGYKISINGVRDLSSSPNANVPFDDEAVVLFPGGLVELEGFVVFEAENYDRIVGESWVLDEERGGKENISGGAAMVHPNGSPGGENASKLLYDINFASSGRKIVWYRAGGENGSDDSGWLHIDGGRPPSRSSGNNASMTGFSGNVWEWNSNAQSGPDPIDFILETAGLHEFGLARREDGSFFDKFIITTDQDYNPNDDDDGFNRSETRTAGEPLANPRIVVNQAPQDTDGVAGRTATFSVDVETFNGEEPNSSVIINWAVNGEDIDAAGPTYTTASLSSDDDGAQVQAIIRVPGLRVVTEPATLNVTGIRVVSLSPDENESGVAIDASQIEIVVGDGASTVDENNVGLTVYGNEVEPSVSKVDDVTSITYALDRFLPGDTDIDVHAAIGTTDGDVINYSYSFRTEGGVTVIPPSFAGALGSGSGSGFSVRTEQADATPTMQNNTERGEAQLAGGDLSAFAGGEAVTSLFSGQATLDFINWNQSEGGNNGAARNDTGWPDQGLQGLGLMGDHTDQISAEITTYLEFPEAGLYRTGVSSDDGFRITLARTADEHLNPDAPVLEVDVLSGGRGGGTSNTPQNVQRLLILEPGVYSFRTIWYEGTGGANMEWTTPDVDGTWIPINAEGTAIRAFTSRAGDPAAVEGDPFDIDVSAQILQPGDDRPVDGGGGDGGPTGPVPPAGYSAKSSLNIAFVSFHGESDTASADAAAAGFTEASDKGYTDLLEAAGHSVTRVVTSNSPDVDLMNSFDVVIISRAVSSGHYSGAGASAWSSVETPTLILGGYVLRTSRLGLTQGTTMVDSAETIRLHANHPGHPLFNGVGLDDNGTMTSDFADVLTVLDQVQRGVSVNNNEIAGGGTVLATVATESDPTAGGIVAAEWRAGASLANDAGDVLAGHRVVLLTGSREQGFTSQGAGVYDLASEDAARLFLNAVEYTGDLGLLPVGYENANSLDIAFVSFHGDADMASADAAAAGFVHASDRTYTDLLQVAGHNVTRVVTSNSPDVDSLNGYDLVIISRAVSSGHYSNAGAAAWSSVETPTLILGGYVLRTSRLGLTEGTTMVDSAGTIRLNASDPSHPIFDGVALDANGTMESDFADVLTVLGQLQRGVSINNNPIAAGGTVLATVATDGDPTVGGLVAGEWSAGAVTANGAGDVLAGPRVVLLTGSREQGFTSQGAGVYDLASSDAARLFLNTVGYTGGLGSSSGGAAVGIGFSNGEVTLSWESGTLQSAPSVNGPWSDVTNTSPHSEAATAAAAFYRVAQ